MYQYNILTDLVHPDCLQDKSLVRESGEWGGVCPKETSGINSNSRISFFIYYNLFLNNLYINMPINKTIESIIKLVNK